MDKKSFSDVIDRIGILKEEKKNAGMEIKECFNLLEKEGYDIGAIKQIIKIIENSSPDKSKEFGERIIEYSDFF